MTDECGYNTFECECTMTPEMVKTQCTPPQPEDKDCYKVVKKLHEGISGCKDDACVQCYHWAYEPEAQTVVEATVSNDIYDVKGFSTSVTLKVRAFRKHNHWRKELNFSRKEAQWKRPFSSFRNSLFQHMNTSIVHPFHEMFKNTFHRSETLVQSVNIFYIHCRYFMESSKCIPLIK